MQGLILSRAELAAEHERDVALLDAAARKIDKMYTSLHPSSRAKPNEQIMMKLTIGELRVLRLFIAKHDNG